MTVSRGVPWGVDAVPPAGLRVVDGDAELADALGAVDAPPLAVSAGDLWRTVGAPRVVPHPSMRRVPVDRLRVHLDGVEVVAVAHVICRRAPRPIGWIGWWRGSVLAVANAEFRGRWDIAPRSHPNDGRADVIEVRAEMGWRARWQAWRRLPSGTHVPHPAISTTRTTEMQRRFDPPTDVWVDGRRHRRIRALRVTVEPDAFELYV